MTKIAILPVSIENDVLYHAVTKDKQSQGKTAGEALDALTAQLSEEETQTLIVVQNLRPDRFFNQEQQRRLAELVERWRILRDQGENLPDNEQSELNMLVEAELNASANRAAALADELRR